MATLTLHQGDAQAEYVEHPVEIARKALMAAAEVEWDGDRTAGVKSPTRSGFRDDLVVPIARQVARRAKLAVLSFGGWVVTALGFAFVAAFFTLPTNNTWLDRAGIGLVASGITLAGVLGIAFIWHGVAYLRTRGSGEWLVTARVAKNAVWFQLRRDPAAMPEALSVHRVLGCQITTPSQVELTPPVHDGGGITAAPHPHTMVEWLDAGVERTPPEYGVYVVRWYGSQKRNRFYEITRAFIDVTEDDIGRRTVGRRRRGRTDG